MKVHLLFESQDRRHPNGSSYLRCIQPLTHPRNAGRLHFSLGADLPDTPLDLVIIDRLWRHDLDGERQATLFAELAARRLPFVHALDDNLLDEPLGTPRPGLPSPHQRILLRRFLRAARAALVTTPILARRVAPLTRQVILLENQLDERLFADPPPPPRSDGRLRIGYMGTPTHLDDLLTVLHPLRRVLARWRERVELELIGVASPMQLQSLFADLPVTLCQPPTDCVAYPRFMSWLRRTARWDFAIAPLRDDAFNAAKSDLKILDYGILGVPAIASATPSYASTIRHEETGLLVANRPEDWEAALTRMIEDDALRQRLATRICDYVRAERTLDRHAERWGEALAAVLDDRATDG